MGKRRIDADVALKDIRAGMIDADLMAKYRLSASGLQSLFNKLLLAGLIELKELDLRMPTFMGTMFVSQLIQPLDDTEKQSSGKPPQEKSSPPIKLTTVMKDIRSGATDSELMGKYHLSAKGLQSLLEHLVFSGLMKQIDVHQRSVSLDSTVDVHGLKERLRGKSAKSSSTEWEEAPWYCPACGKPQAHEMDECPVCGVIISKYMAKLDKD